MNRDHVTEYLDDYIDGELDPGTMKIVEEHLSSCPSCRREAEELGRLVAGVRGLPREIDPPAAVLDTPAEITGPRPARTRIFAFRKNGHVNAATAPARTGWKFRLPAYAMRAAAVVAVIACAGLAWKIFGPFPTDAPGGEVPPAMSVDANRALTPPEKTVAEEPVAEEERPSQPPADVPELQKPVTDHRGADGPALAGRGLPEMAPAVPLYTAPAPKKTVVGAAPVSPPSLARNAPAAQGKTSSNTGSLRGKITLATTGEPLSGANVLVAGTTRGAVTDSGGNFMILGVPPGKYTLRVSAIGYAPSEALWVEVNAGETTKIDFHLTSAEVPIAGVTVTADQQLVNSQVTRSLEAAAADKSGVKKPEVSSGWKLQSLPENGEMTPDNWMSKQNLMRPSEGRMAGIENFGWGEQDRSASGSESYDRITETGFRDASDQPLSTFSIDVDAASYANVRRFINAGRRPPRDAVRIEEMINYFTYDYPAPERGRPFSVTTELAQCPWNDGNLLLMVGIQGKKIDVEDLPPGNLVFLIDVSGSMKSANKLPLLRSAFKLLVGQLREEDRISIVVYAGKAGLVLPPTSGYDKRRILDAIDGLEAGGSTAGGAGIRLAYAQARESFIEGGNNRVILATDGDFNVGVSSDAEMVRLIERERDDGIFLSVLGFGTGNLKDSKMEKLADRGNGNYSYIDNIQEAKRVFVGQLSGTLYTIAKDVKIQMEFNPDAVTSYRLIGYENRVMPNRDFRDDRKDAGELGAGHTVTALYEIVPVGADGEDDGYAGSDRRFRDRRPVSGGGGHGEIATARLRYKEPDDDRAREISRRVEDDRPSIDRASRELRFAAAVAEFGMLLRDSEFSGRSSYRQVLRLAGGAMGSDPGGYRAEFLRLVESAAAMFGRE